MATGTQLRLGLKDRGRVVSAEEFADADFDEPWSYEREGGRLVVMPPDGNIHQITSEPWRDALVVYKLARPDVVGHVFSNPFLRVDEDKDRIGDLGVFLVDTPVPASEVGTISDLVFEIVSQGKANKKRDYVTKRTEYEALGVKEYVIVDRFERRVTVLALGSGGYTERVLTEVDTYTSPLLPGLAIPIGDAFGG